MDVSVIIALLKVVAANLPGAISTTEQLVELGTKFMATVNGHEPTAEEVAALRAQVDADVALALEPLPPAQPDDPDYQPPT